MGFLSTATTITLTAKLTNIGRERLLLYNNNIFSHFMLGDSDANYNTSAKLTTGKILAAAGDDGDNGSINNTTTIKSVIYKNNGGAIKKQVATNSNAISTQTTNLNNVTVSGDNLTYAQLSKKFTSSQLTNLFKSFSLPLTSARENIVTGTTSLSGGWSDTSLSGFGATKILVGVINNNSYGELIDGKNIKITLPIYSGYTTGGTPTGVTTYDFYSTFISDDTTNAEILDSRLIDKSIYTTGFFNSGVNVSYLVSDNIQRPNDDAGKSWSTGYDAYKPFKNANKELILPKSVNSTGIIADKIAGIAYLDKGALVFTDKEVVDNIDTNFSGDTDSFINLDSSGLYYYSASTYNSVVNSIVNEVVQNIICIADRGEFYSSQNETIDLDDDVRISEIAITDSTGLILAFVKPDRQIVKKKNDFVVFDIQIVL